MLLQQMHLMEYVITKVPHRHFVFTIPIILRKNFFWHRESLNDLSRLAWATLCEFFQRTLNKSGKAGSIQAIETSGEYHDINPHIHAVATDGLFVPTGTFYVMPKYDEGALVFLKSLWEKNVTTCLEKGYARPETISKLLCRHYTGFSVYAESKIDYAQYNENTKEKMGYILRYILKPTLSLEKLEMNEDGKRVLYKGSFHPGKKRNFQIYIPEDFIAALTSHIPNKGQKYVNYYGWYSNKTRGLQAKQETAELGDNAVKETTLSQKEFRKTWAILIKKIYEVDPLICPKCQTQMKVVSIVVDDYVIKNTLDFYEIKTKGIGRGPPGQSKDFEDIQYVPMEENSWSVDYAE